MTTNQVSATFPATPPPAKNGNFDEVCSFNRRGLFLGGCPKSGTTLLLALLDGHPELVVLPEETRYVEQRRRYRALPDFRARLQHLLTRTELRGLGPDQAAPGRESGFRDARCYHGFDTTRFVRLAHEFVHKPWMSDSLLLSETIRAYAVTRGDNWRECVRWVEKTPSNVPRADELFRLFPDAKVIQIVRDPRAVFASRKRRLTYENGRYTKAHRLVREWNESTRQITRLRDYPDKYLLVPYEHLVQNPRPVLETVCRFVGIQFHPRLLEPTLADNRWAGNSTFHRTLGGIDRQPLEHWREQLTRQELWWIEFHCRAGMEIAGYPLLTDGSFSVSRWQQRLPGESWKGYLHARKSSLAQMAGLLEDCRYGGVPDPGATSTCIEPSKTTCGA